MSHVLIVASTLGQLVQPFLRAMAWLLALFFSFTHNYIVSITLLTVLVMLVTAPLTVKSTRSMMEMQRLAPEVKKLQAKYKKEERDKLNEEMMALYREHGVNPVGGCLPILAQAPFFMLLYAVIRGLTNTVVKHHVTIPMPRYLSSGSEMYRTIIAAHGKLVSFGIDLAQKPFEHHGSFLSGLPYWVIFFGALALQYIQMARLNKRNAAQGMQMTEQQRAMRNMQYFMPLVMGFIYIEFPIGITVYFLVSSLCRISIQEIMFHAGITKVRPLEERVPGSAPGRAGDKPARRTFLDRVAEAQERAREQVRLQEERRAGIDQTIETNPKRLPPVSGQLPKPVPKGGNGATPRTPAGGKSGPSSNGANGSSGDGRQQHPRSKSKRPRRAR